MDLTQLRHLVDAHGVDVDNWRAAERAAAARLIETDQEARAYLTQARDMDRAIARSVKAEVDSRLIDRVLARLGMRPLPAQKRRFLPAWWPSALVDLDFAPAWPRIAALACVAVLGFTIGLSSIGRSIAANTGGTARPAGEAGFTSALESIW